MHFQFLTCLIILFLYLPSLYFCDPRITEAARICGKSEPLNTLIVPIFVEETRQLLELIRDDNWGQYLLNTSDEPMYGLAQCYQDLSKSDCLSCYAAIRTRIPSCLPALSGRLYLDGCFMRYDTYEFYNESLDSARDSVNCSGGVIRNEDKVVEFNESVGLLIGKIVGDDVWKKGFGVGEVEGVFGLAQCWKSLSKEGCRKCLENAGDKVRGCLPSREGRGMNAGCYLRYSDFKFFNQDGHDNNNGGSGALSTGAITGIAISASAFLILLLVAAYVYHTRSPKRGRRSLDHRMTFNRASLTYKYDILEKATDYFSQSMKLGEGASGTVYQGTLPDGYIVAVKRLFFNTNRQWADEVFNEVNLISGIQHKNLVKLLGCSIEGPESLLVYEYVPNKSLDQFLFDRSSNSVLSWKQRFDIILGTAEGLAHLHGGSDIRIIHRDIKSSNVLLDENFTPKIADFGLVRCFGADKTQLNTGIAGTLGYMAPEYLVRGQLTEKADVYSFGVLVFEIVCGRKNVAFVDDTGSLIQTIWKLYKANKLTEVVDRRLDDDFPVRDALKILQIGLLCAQASPIIRPSMDEVVQMLISKDCEVPIPSQPPFLSAKLEGSASSGRSYSTDTSTLISSALDKKENDISYDSTYSSGVPINELSLIRR
ncbi:cysteine-rich receptor-like protein kinase 42 isoform X2 [Daucus carota subsp. sativus]|uniref:cysteine-rich receptor-like protein kinase 42 isoform X2 n=1 Tax=Daucus carota subsp. sativus TaxID=79200 RepID=UPI0007EF8C4F|nr:PREDICTED: cysteine-rich receptor-like protein kinase 42 isoform X2 [Daucus carota subsp. sativus]